MQELIDYNAAGATEKVADSFVLWEVHVHVPVCLTELWVLRGAEKIKLVDVFGTCGGGGGGGGQRCEGGNQ